MADYAITIINDHSRASSDADHAGFTSAREQALKGAIEIGMEQVIGGKQLFGAEVVIDCDGRTQRFVVSVGVAALL